MPLRNTNWRSFIIFRNSDSNEAFSVTPPHQLGSEDNSSVAELHDVEFESDTGKDRLRMEIKRLKRVVWKKDLVIDLLMEKIVKLQRYDISAKNETTCNDHLDSIHHPSWPSTLSLDVLCDGATAFHSVATEDNYFLQTTGNRPSNVFTNATVKPERVFIGKSSKHKNSKRHESHSKPKEIAQVLEFSNTATRCFPCLNDTFVLPDSSGTTEINVPTKNKGGGSVVKSRANGSDQDCRSNRSRYSRNVFVIEGFSSSSEGSHPDWKAPLPPSLCLRKNRPELIRRIEHRQAAIRAAAILRRRVTEEKMKAARDVIQGRCTVNNVRRSLMLDPTRITAFPKSEMINLTKRRLRSSFAYKSEISGGKSRVDIAASKIIAHTFSEATRLAILAGRHRGC